MSHHAGQRGDRAVVHVRRGQRGIAQPGHLELAIGLDGERDPPGALPGRALAIVAEAAQQREPACPHRLDAVVAPPVETSVGAAHRDADLVELAVAELRSEVAQAALAAADEQPQSAFRRFRIAGLYRPVAARQRIAEIVERRAAGDQRRLERRQRLADVGEHLVVLGRGGRLAEHLPVAAFEVRLAAHQRGHMALGTAHLAGVGERAQAGRPQAVGRSRPAEPAIETRVGHARRVALGVAQAGGGRAPIGPLELGHMAACAGDRPAARQAGVEEQPLSEGGGQRGCADPVARIWQPTRWPRTVLQDLRNLVWREGRSRSEGGSVRGRAEGSGRDGCKHSRRASCHAQPRPSGGHAAQCHAQPSVHRTITACVARSALSPSLRTSNISSQLPGMWNSRPSAR